MEQPPHLRGEMIDHLAWEGTGYIMLAHLSSLRDDREDWFPQIEELLVAYGYPKRGIRGRFNKMTDEQVNELIHTELAYQWDYVSARRLRRVVEDTCGKAPKKAKAKPRPTPEPRPAKPGRRALDLGPLPPRRRTRPKKT